MQKEGVKQSIIDADERDIKGFCQNPQNRCYICKKYLFTKMLGAADNIAEGSNKDDEGDYRPGLVAIAELGIKSPLREAGLCKKV